MIVNDLMSPALRELQSRPRGLREPAAVKIIDCTDLPPRRPKREARTNPTAAQVEGFLAAIQPGADRMARLVALTARFEVEHTAGGMGDVRCILPGWVQAAIKQHHEHVQATARAHGIA